MLYTFNVNYSVSLNAKMPIILLVYFTRLTCSAIYTMLFLHSYNIGSSEIASIEWNSNFYYFFGSNYEQHVYVTSSNDWNDRLTSIFDKLGSISELYSWICVCNNGI